jgi:protein-tyrosine phosphatase
MLGRSDMAVGSVLFICTGNIFRSMVAEYALKNQLAGVPGIIVGSAGIEALTQPMHPLIRERLLSRGVDPSGHLQRKLTQELLEQADLSVAMGLNHQEYIRAQFGRDVPLFNEICYNLQESVLDIHEAMPEWHVDMDRTREYALAVVDYIWNSMPAFLAGIARLKKA